MTWNVKQFLVSLSSFWMCIQIEADWNHETFLKTDNIPTLSSFSAKWGKFVCVWTMNPKPKIMPILITCILLYENDCRFLTYFFPDDKVTGRVTEQLRLTQLGHDMFTCSYDLAKIKISWPAAMWHACYSGSQHDCFSASEKIPPKYILITSARFSSIPSIKSIMLRLSASQILCHSGLHSSRLVGAFGAMQAKWLRRKWSHCVRGPAIDWAVRHIKLRGQLKCDLLLKRVFVWKYNTNIHTYKNMG